MTLFRPCIDLHDGRVKQIVGGTLSDDGPAPTTNFVADESPKEFAARYARDGLGGGHIIKLGPGNDEAAIEALAGFPGGMQLGGGVNAGNASEWLARGASHVIVTSFLFEGGALSMPRVEAMAKAVTPERLVIDLSCRRVADGYRVATNKWQTVTETPVDAHTLERLAPYCAEFLVHAADVEGLCRGVDMELVTLLGDSSPRPVTYAGGGRAMSDLEAIEARSAGRVDLTFGSALDLFGGSGVRYDDCVAWNRARAND